MATWRYAARLASTADKTEWTTHAECPAGSEEQGLRQLTEFLDIQKQKYGCRVRWVALERSEGGLSWYHPYGRDWREVKRLPS